MSRYIIDRRVTLQPSSIDSWHSIHSKFIVHIFQLILRGMPAKCATYVAPIKEIPSKKFCISSMVAW